MSWLPSLLRFSHHALAYLVLTILLTSNSASAVAVPPPYTQFAHKAWRVSEGEIPAMPTAIAQTPDGYIWIGTPSGLFRFDGQQFTKFDAGDALALKLDQIFSLRVDSSGTLWIGTGGDVLRIANGHLDLVLEKVGRVNSILQDRDGRIWFARSRNASGSVGGLCRIDQKTMSCLGSLKECMYGGTVVEDSEGAIWIGGSADICRLKDRELTSIKTSTMDHTRDLSAVSTMAPNDDGSILVGYVRDGLGGGLQRMSAGISSPVSLPELDATTLTVGSVFVDREKGLWIGTLSAGLIHVHEGRLDRMGTQDGLSGSTVETIFQDAQGNIWAGSDGGLDRFQKAEISEFGIRQGGANNAVTSVLALRDGRVLAGGRHGLTVISESGIEVLGSKEGFPGQVVTSMLEGKDETVWLGADDTLVTWKDNRFSVVDTNGISSGAHIGMAEDAEGSVWVLNARKPVNLIFSIAGDQSVNQITPPDNFQPSLLGADTNKQIWAVSRSGELARATGSALLRVSTPPTPFGANDVSFAADSSIWVASNQGLHVFSEGQWRTLSRQSGLPCDQVQSMVHDMSGSLWLKLRCAFFSISDSQLRAFAAGSTDRVRGAGYGTSSVVGPGGSTFSPSAAVDTHNRLWFASDHPMQMIDVPSRPSAAPAPPPIHIESIIVDGNDVPISEKVTLPKLAKDVSISYVGLDFKDPLGVEYRYNLSGRDNSWTSVQGRRTALFSNLHPGTYRFNVQAASRNGTWNEPGDSVSFVIPPAFYQTIWFQSVLVVLGCLIVWGLIALRVKRVADAVEARLMERLSERSRIARDLHDTLLQSVQSTALLFQNVVDGIRDDDPAKELLLHSLSKADKVIDETREKVHDLRVEEGRSGSIIDDINLIFEELRTGESPSLGCKISGLPRELKQDVRREITAIARELVLNSLNHARASTIYIELLFLEKEFVFIAADDGIGIPPEVLRKGQRNGHWGLLGIRERASRIGATLTVRSTPDSGTRTSVEVNRKSAYFAPVANFRKPLSFVRWLGWWLPVRPRP